ncbi:MAG TPA: glucosaminidase domain-containing protein [Ktedonobacteraceae bacterium]|nr:glucosaminidase domain-containing protein [Ktedonobacteraceae bacterium]
MARGSSYGNKPTEQLTPKTPPTHIPRRATRAIAAIREESESETQAERPLRARRSAARTTTVINTPPVRNHEETHPQPSSTQAHSLTRHHSWLRLLLFTIGGVVVGAIVLAIAGMYLRPPISVSPNYQGQSFPIQLGGSYGAYTTWENSNGPIAAKTAIPTNPGPYSVVGKPTISAAFINEVLATYHSPTAGMGQDLYNLGIKYGIDPVYALAFFMHESLFGTTGEARVTLSLGNERCIPDRPCINTAGTACQQGQSCYAKMYSWQDGFEQWYKLIRNLYVAQWGLVTVDQIIPVYAPSSDHNNVAGYIAALKHTVDTWRAGIVVVS